MNRALLCAILSVSVVAEAGRAAPTYELLVGTLTRQAVRECRGNLEEHWVQPHHEVGFVWLRSGAKLVPKSLLGKLVVVEGKPAARPAINARSTSQCPAMQMRSDCVAGVNGMRIMRSGQPALSAFAVRRVRPFVGLTIKQAADNVAVRFRNAFGRELRRLTLRMHYEGCYGKPDAPHKDHRFPVVSAGATVTARFPLLDEDKQRPPGRRQHRASSLQVLSSTPNVHLAIDWPLAKARPAVIVRCPRR